MSRKPRLGLIATGHGPRQEYIDFHARFLRALGVEVDIFMRNALDGLSLDEIRDIPISPGSAVIHSYVHSPTETSERFGPGWGEAIMERTRYIPLVQKCLDELENTEKVDATIWCCAEPFPDGTFRCTKPLLMPYLVGLQYAEIVARSIGGGAVIGVFTHGARQREQQIEMWDRQTWATRAKVHFEDASEGLKAAKRMAGVKPDLVILWGYGVGLAPGDPPDGVASLEKALGQPILLLHTASTLLVRNMLWPSVNGRDYVRGGS